MQILKFYKFLEHQCSGPHMSSLLLWFGSVQQQHKKFALNSILYANSQSRKQFTMRSFNEPPFFARFVILCFNFYSPSAALNALVTRSRWWPQTVQELKRRCQRVEHEKFIKTYAVLVVFGCCCMRSIHSSHIRK